MSRGLLIGLSVVDCAFGATALSTDGATSAIAYGLNFTLAALLAVLTWQDLRSRGSTWQAAASVTYLIAPLVGLVLYAAFSGRAKQSDRELAHS